MANTLSIYDPIFYANEALIWLTKALGMAGRIHRGYDASPQQKGSTISIRRPSTFAAADAPSTKQDITASKVDITLNNWREVKFALSDKELAFTKEDIIREHIGPAAYALADDVDGKLAALYKDVGHAIVAAGAAATVAEVLAVRKTLFNNKVPMKDPAMLHFMIDGGTEADLLAIDTFNRVDASGNNNVQLNGSLGRRFGLEFFANQNVLTHVQGTISVTMGTLAVTGAHAKGATSVLMGATAVTGTIKKGDYFLVAGDSQAYAVTADATFAANAVTVTVSPALRVALAGANVVTFTQSAKRENISFHRNAFALATAPLSEMGNELGAKIATVTDPVSGISLRSRVFYVGDNSEVRVALDILYGFITLDPDLAVRYRMP